MDSADSLIVRIKQGNRSIERYIKEFLELAPKSSHSDLLLMMFFWGGLLDPVRSQMPLYEEDWNLYRFIEAALLISGSPHSVALKEENPQEGGLSGGQQRGIFLGPADLSKGRRREAGLELRAYPRRAVRRPLFSEPLESLLELCGTPVSVPVPQCPPVSTPAPEEAPCPVNYALPSQITRQRRHRNRTAHATESPPVSAPAPERPPVSASAPERPPVSASAPERPPVSASAPERPPVSASAPERPPVSAPAPERPPVSAPAPERPPVSAPAPERPPVSAPAPERPPVSAPAPERPPVSIPVWPLALPAPLKLLALPASPRLLALLAPPRGFRL
ncbi:uncharacterized protein isoform X2 [Danio rerio]|uniref:Uncharacterized protein isoform X2 n=1 Tax=Danio rerio TaxID=7955 RepID=A0AC58HVU5_DANRE